jgi:hypothetical protein
MPNNTMIQRIFFMSSPHRYNFVITIIQAAM